MTISIERQDVEFGLLFLSYLISWYVKHHVGYSLNLFVHTVDTNDWKHVEAVGQIVFVRGFFFKSILHWSHSKGNSFYGQI